MFSAIPRLWSRGGSRSTLAKEALLGARTAGVPTFREAMPAIALELRRARRYERPLTALAVGPSKIANSGSRTATGGDPAFAGTSPVPPSHMASFLLGSLLRDVLRETDIVTYSPEHHLYAMLLPESSEIDAASAIGRVSRVIHDRAEIRLSAGIAEFPRDGLTVEDLFQHSRSVMRPLPWLDCVPVLKRAASV